MEEEEAESLFNLLKNSLYSITSLSTADNYKPLEIHTVSLTGINAWLLQQDQEGKLKPETFASQKLTSAQSKWSTERWALSRNLGNREVWNVDAYGISILLDTYHNP